MSETDISDTLLYDEIENVNEEEFKHVPWALNLIDEVQNFSKQATLKWLRFVLEIDGSKEANSDCIQIFLQQVKNVYKDLVLDIASLHQKYLYNIEKYSNRIVDLEKVLNIQNSLNQEGINSGLSLKEYEAKLKTQITEYEHMLFEKEAELGELNKKYLSLVKCLNVSPKYVSSEDSPNFVEKFRRKIQILEDKKNNREKQFFKIKKDLEECSEKYGIPFDKERLSQIDTSSYTEENMKIIEKLRDQQILEKDNLDRKCKNLKIHLNNLWDLLEISLNERKMFYSDINNFKLYDCIDALKTEIEKMEGLKNLNLNKIIESTKEKIKSLWDICLCGPETRNSFPQIYSNEINEELFKSFEKEFEKWNNYYNQHKNIFQVFDDYSDLKNKLQEKELNEDSQQLYKNRGGTLLRELKERKQLCSKIQLVEKKLKRLAYDYLQNTGSPFLVYGKTLEEYLKKESNKKGIDRTGKYTKNILQVTSFDISQASCSKSTAVRNKQQLKKIPPLVTQSAKLINTVPSKKKVSEKHLLPKFKLNQSKNSHTSPVKKRWTQLVPVINILQEEDEDSWDSDYGNFEENVKTRSRSTSFQSLE